jgi:hypothetical protein
MTKISCRHIHTNEDYDIIRAYHRHRSITKTAKNTEWNTKRIRRAIKNTNTPIYHKKGNHHALFGFTGATIKKGTNPEKKHWQARVMHNRRMQTLFYYHDPLSASIVYQLVAEELDHIKSGGK